MGDPMAGAMPPMPGGGLGGKPSTSDVLRQKRSLLNPVDVQMAGDAGVFEKSMAEFFSEYEIDVNAPGSMKQFMKFAGQQAQDAQGMEKMSALAGSQPSADPMGGMGPGSGAPPAGMQQPSGNPLDELMN